jgi:hypothetical protein
MGLTANCAVCHDHKFDPITQREFYSLSAYFNNTTQPAMDGNVKDTAPTILVPQPEDRPRWNVLSKELTKVRQLAESRKQAARPEFDKWLVSGRPEQVKPLIPATDLRFHARLDEGKGATLHAAADGKAITLALRQAAAWDVGHVSATALKTQPSDAIAFGEAGDFEKNQPFSYGAWINLTKRAQFGAIFARMDNEHDYRGWDLWTENNRIGTHIISKWQNDALKVIANTPLKLRQWYHVFVTYDGSARASGVKIYINGVPQETTNDVDGLKKTIRTSVPFKVGQRHNGQRVEGVLIQDVRLYGRALSGAEVERLMKSTRAAWLASKPADKRTAAEKDELFNWWLAGMDNVYQGLAGQITALQQEESAIKSRGTVAHVMQERPGMSVAYVLYRGEYDKRRDPVKPETPRSLPPLPPDVQKNRLGLARWLLRPEHPLTARVTVNRFWQELFGTGIVRTSEDFGVMGELPSHPELLDWLAVEFRESGWNVKQFFKLLVNSAAYRQAALATPEKLEKDPQNRYLSRGPRFRMDAEMIRDYALAASGTLVEKVGGPSVKPYQPEGVWEAVAMIGSNTRDYQADAGNKLYRRSLYTLWKRAAPPASMDIFNAPTREVCTVRRERTDTPLQALVTLNDPQFVEAARWLATAALKRGDDSTDARLDYMARRLLSRPLRTEEMRVVRENLADLLSYYKAHGDDAKKLVAVGESKPDPSLDRTLLAAWTMTANEMMNLDEVLNK